MRSSLLRTILATSSTLGNLQVLPIEIVYDIRSLLDIQFLFNFCHVNRCALQIVRKIRGYEATITHALGAQYVILKTNIASLFTISGFFGTLCTKDCHLCRFFGGFIFLPSFIGCCFSCIRYDHLPYVLPLSAMKKRFKLSPSGLYSLVPTETTLPGTYSFDAIVRNKRTQIMPTELAGRLCSSKGDKSTGVTRPKGTRLLGHMVTTSLPYLDIESGVIQNGICCSGCQIWLERSDGARSSSFPSANPYTLRHKVYSYNEFMEHFLECREA